MSYFPSYFSRCIDFNSELFWSDNVNPSNASACTLNLRSFALHLQTPHLIVADVAPRHIRILRRFRSGHDYSVAHYVVLTTNSVLDATLCFCPGEGKQCAFDEAANELMGSDDDAIWESGDVGGFECYIAADEGGRRRDPMRSTTTRIIRSC